jgi:hypothetical protein
MGIKTTVGQVALAGGGLYDQPSNILVEEHTSPLSRGRGRGNLYLLMEVTGPDLERDAVTRLLAQAVHQAYFRWRGSVTAGLREAIRQANELLLDENRNSLPGERRAAGISCLVLRNDDLFIAQAGPAAVYLLRSGEVDRFPDESPWLDGSVAEGAEAAALGDRHDVHVHLFHSEIRNGDTILIVGSELASVMSANAWPEILTQPTVGQALQELIARGGVRELSALVIRMGEESAAKVLLHPPPQPEEQVSVQPDAVRQAAAVPQCTTASEDAGTRSEPSLRTPPQEVGKAPRPSLGERLSTTVAQLAIGRRLQALFPALGAALASLGAGLLAFFKQMVPGRVALQPEPERPVAPVVKVGKPPGKARKARLPADLRSEPVQRLLVGVAIAIPVIVAIIVLVAWVQRGQAQRSDLGALLVQAEAYWQQSETSADLNAVRADLTEAQQLLDQVLADQPDNAQAIELQNKIRSRLDVINKVQRVRMISELASYPADANLTRVVVQGAHIFVLDRLNGKVYHHQIDEQLETALDPATRDTVLVSRGSQVGDGLVGDLVDMVWMSTGPGRQKASLVILESGGRLLDYDPATQQLTSLRVAASGTWQYPKLAGSHSGRLYVLDASANKILRYDPTPDGYSSSPQEWLQEPLDLAGVIDMAIGDSIYLLYTDGGMRKLTAGRPDAFDISDWDIPPSNPAAVFTRPPDETQWIYVADKGNSRIVQVSDQGRFKQQFRLAEAEASKTGDALSGATDLFVDEIAGNAYLLSGQKLYLLVLPMSE